MREQRDVSAAATVTAIPRRIVDLVRSASLSSPSRFAVVVFTMIILLWAVILSLPISSATGTATSPAIALFTAVSTVCVTGLSVVEMSTYWSGFGHVVIFIGLEVGAIGVLTLASILGSVVTRKLGLRQKLIAASDGNALRMHRGAISESQAVRLGDIGGVLSTVAISLVLIQTVVAIAILPVLLSTPDYGPWWVAVVDSYYYAASAFTNTGFTPNQDGLAPFTGNLFMLTPLAIAVFAGSLGFPVIFALARWFRTRQRLSVHVRLTLVTTTILLFLGWAAIYVLEFSNPGTLGAQEGWLAPFTAGFTSVMTRSGGMSTIDISQMHDSTFVVMDMLMFVGGGSASTAGGIKVTTLAIMFLAAAAEAKGVDDMQVFGRRIPIDVLRLAVSVALWGGTIIAVASVLVMHVTGTDFKYALFDTISAFATCGLSSGLTRTLPESGMYVLTVTMWLGRVGTVTMAAALASRERKQLYHLPEERIIVG